MLNKSNKETVIKLVNTLSCALARSNDLLKLAAADVDKLKTDQLRLQNDLLATKDEVLISKKEQLDAVTSTVKTEIKTWADVVSTKCNSGAVITPSKIKEAVKSAVIEEDRLFNVMVYGVNESGGEDSRVEDKSQIAGIMHEIGIFSGDVIVSRVREVRECNIRPLRVRFERKEEVLEVLSRARRLKDSAAFSSVFLGPDRTVDERKVHKKLVGELKRKRGEFPDQVFFIKGNSVCSRPRTVQD